MNAVKYFEEKARMINSLGGIAGDCICVSCADCPLSIDNNGMDYSCGSLETVYPEKAVAIVEKWSEEHPHKTILSDFLEKYPNAILIKDGVPFGLCIQNLGFDKYDKCDCKNSCAECWNRPLESD